MLNTQQQKKNAKEPKRMGRPVTRPTAKKIMFNLCEDYIQKIHRNAQMKTNGNKSILLEKILAGEMVLE